MASNNSTAFAPHGISVPCSSCKTGLNYLNNSDIKREKGKITLYCPNCSLKHFGVIEDLAKWCLGVKQEERAAKREGRKNAKSEQVVEAQSAEGEVVA